MRPNQKEYAKRIKKMVKEKGVTNLKIAEKVGITPITLSAILNCKIAHVSDRTLDRIFAYVYWVNTNEIEV